MFKEEPGLVLVHVISLFEIFSQFVQHMKQNEIGFILDRTFLLPSFELLFQKADATHREKCGLEKKQGQKLKAHLFFLQFSSGDQWCMSALTTGPDSTRCVCVCLSVRACA